MTGKMRHAASFFLAAVMTLSLAFSHGVPVYADGGNITIASVEDLEGLAKNCKLDTWSQGETVTLTADLDLTDYVTQEMDGIEKTQEGLDILSRKKEDVVKVLIKIGE